jgi:hypothetical protein
MNINYQYELKFVLDNASLSNAYRTYNIKEALKIFDWIGNIQVSGLHLKVKS